PSAPTAGQAAQAHAQVRAPSPLPPEPGPILAACGTCDTACGGWTTQGKRSPPPAVPGVPAIQVPCQLYFVGPLPVQFGGLVALMRRASFTSSLTAPVTGSDSRALSLISATTCMSFSAQVNEIMSHSLRASELPELIISASRSLTSSM